MHSEQLSTMQTALSQPFAGNDALRPKSQRLQSVLNELTPKGRAQFLDHPGQSIPWSTEFAACHLGVAHLS
jgi:hypothetical protein